jgi:acylphosphatase
METVRLLIKGKVQGVFYRASARDRAVELGIKGWVKNTPEGNVEVVATGEKENLEKFIDWCRNGPSKAVVVDVVITKSNEHYHESFHIQK